MPQDTSGWTRVMVERVLDISPDQWKFLLPDGNEVWLPAGLVEGPPGMELGSEGVEVRVEPAAAKARGLG